MSIRFTYILGFLVVVGLLLISAYLQIFDDFIPCPLCTLQRFAFALFGILFFIGILFYRQHKMRVLINLSAFFTSLAGILLAGRQIWLQLMPNPHAECGVSLQYMLKALPLTQVMSKIFLEGSSECTKRGFEFLYLNMAEWSLISFSFLFLLVIYLLCKEF